jgi:hypothetical protein
MNSCNIIELGGRINGNFTRNYFININDLNKHINRYTDDTYMTIYRYDSKDQNTANFIAPMYFDLDIDDIEQNFIKIKQDLSLVMRKLKTLFHISDNDIDLYFSGSKGFHILIDSIIFGFEPGRELNKQYKKIATELNTYTINKSIDTRIYDNKRLFRVPNTINSKTGLYKVTIEYNTFKQMNNWNELKDFASTPREKAEFEPRQYNQKAREQFYSLLEKIDIEEKSKINTKLAKEFIHRKELLPCVQYILNQGCTKGNRNNTTVALANSLFQIGKTYEEVLEIIMYWNSEKNDEPLDRAEIHATVRSAYNNAKNGIFYGCGAFKDLDVCIKGCPIHK